MASENARAAWVNRSGTTIPVFANVSTPSPAHVGGYTVGGVQLGEIAPNSFYTLIPNDSFYITSFNVRFRSYLGQHQTGYIETSPGYTLPNYGWVASQEPYHYYNSNGSTLVNSATASIGGVTRRVFTINGGSVSLLNSAGVNQGSLAAGTQVATTSSTVGVNFPNFLYITHVRRNNVWETVFPSGNTWGFIDLSIALGVTPSDRRVR